MSELHILQHALGVDKYGQGRQYRNRFVTGKGSVDWPICESLVGAGLMNVHRNYELYGGDDVFFVTDAGKAFVAENSPPVPKLSRSKQRYQRYLDADSSSTFGEWLRSPWSNLKNPA